jgi:hypothetical protein
MPPYKLLYPCLILIPNPGREPDYPSLLSQGQSCLDVEGHSSGGQVRKTVTDTPGVFVENEGIAKTTVATPQVFDIYIWTVNTAIRSDAFQFKPLPSQESRLSPLVHPCRLITWKTARILARQNIHMQSTPFNSPYATCRG